VFEDQFQNAGRILSTCPNLASILMYSNFGLERPEDSLALLDEPWICTNLKELELHGFRPYKIIDFKLRLLAACLERLDQGDNHGRCVNENEEDESGSGNDGNNDGSVYGGELGLVNANEEVGSWNPISKWTRLLAKIPIPNRALYDKLVKEGWTLDKSMRIAMEDVETLSSRIEMAFQHKVFERVLGLPRMRKVTLETTVFIKTRYTDMES
jgi:hypothetical protein